AKVGSSILLRSTRHLRLTILGWAFLFVKRQLTRGSGGFACAGRRYVCPEFCRSSRYCLGRQAISFTVWHTASCTNRLDYRPAPAIGRPSVAGHFVSL